MCLAQGPQHSDAVRLNPPPLGLESSTLPLSHCAPYNILYDLQHGFHEKRSCETQLIQLVEYLASGKQSDLILLDFSKALFCLFVLMLYIPVNNFQSLGMISSLPQLNSYFTAEDEVSCSRTQCNATGEP